MFYDVIQLGGFSLKHCNFNKLAVKIGALISCFTIAMNTIPIGVSASNCTADNCTCGGNEVNPCLWNQGAWGNGINSNWSTIGVGGTSELCKDVGCYATSMAIEMKMSGDYGKICPAAFLNTTKNENVFGGAALNNPNNIYSSTKYAGIWKLFAITADDASKFNISSQSLSDRIIENTDALYKLALDLASEGCYVILRVNYTKTSTEGNQDGDHFIAVVGSVKADNQFGAELLVADPGTCNEDNEKGARFKFKADDPDPESLKDYPISNIKGAAGNPYKATNLCNLRVMVSASKFTGAVNATNSSSSDEKKEQANFNYQGITSFMKEEYFLSDADISHLEEAALTLPNFETLTSEKLDDGTEVRNWSDSINNSHEEKAHRYIKVSIMFLGILVTLYSILLFIAYQFDKINNFIEFDALGILTFHRLWVSPDGERSTYMDKDTSGTKFLTFRDICIVCVTGVALGVLMISGKIFIIGTAILEFVKKIFMKGGFFR